MSLGSGSSGNCYYLGDETGGLLLDAGIPIRSIKKSLAAEGISLEDGHIRGVLVTHDHADHIRTIGVLGAVYHLPVYASRSGPHAASSPSTSRWSWRASPSRPSPCRTIARRT